MGRSGWLLVVSLVAGVSSWTPPHAGAAALEIVKTRALSHGYEAAGHAHGFKLDTTEHSWGCDYFVETGRMMPVDALDTLRSTTRSSSAPSVGPTCPTTSRSGAC